MIKNNDLMIDPRENGYFSASNRASMLAQLCDNTRVFEECVKEVLRHNSTNFDEKALYAFGKANGNDRGPNSKKFKLIKLSVNGISYTQVVNDWDNVNDRDKTNKHDDDRGWPIHDYVSGENLDGYFLAELVWTDNHGRDYVSLRVNKKWKVSLKLIAYYYNNCLKDLIEKNKQIIFTGAPGTGKTFGIRKAIDRLISEPPKDVPDDVSIPDRTKFVQFHSSYDYSDFVEGLRPVSLEEGQNPTFVRMDGVFMKFCRNVAEYNLKQLQVKGIVVSCDDWYEKCKLSANASTEDKQQKKDIKNSINTTQFYFVIDEVNRADIGKVFGELMFGLEEDYRGIENRFATQYSNLSTYYRDENNNFVPYEQEQDVFAKGFFIPENVHIVGSMNNIDRSVDSFDFALRRRFRWHEVTANGAMKPVLIGSFIERQVLFNLEQLEELCKYINNLNTTISGEGKQFGLNESYHIGPAYFKNYEFGTTEDENEAKIEEENKAKREEIWNAGIKHILREYVNGRNEDKVEAFMTKCEKAFIDGTVEA